MDTNAAIEQAVRFTTKIHTEAVPESGARFLQAGLPKVMLIFKRFAMAQIFNIYTLFKGNVRNDMMGDIYRALDWVETLAYYYNNMAATPHEDPNSSNNKNLAEYYNVLIRMYQTVIYVSRQHR
jgi:hypothetical protein